uniref:Uncharacterized protein n=1 Tax=Macaca nemestrina TaxID=9545 RepID=A0A2K6DZI5_MACNE
MEGAEKEQVMLPKPGTYSLHWEVSASQVPGGVTLRTFDRVTLMAQHGSDRHQVLVCTKLVKPFQAQVPW